MDGKLFKEGALKTKKIDEVTLAIFSRCEVDGNLIRLPAGQLERKQYLAVNEILEALGGRWNRKAKAHVFDGDPTDKLETVLLTGEIIRPQDYGYYPTPPELASRLIELAEIEPDMLVLESSAGQGGIADIIRKICEPDCIEILAENVNILAKKGYNVLFEDFLIVDPTILLYDRVIQNPPFSYAGHPQADIDFALHAWKFLKPGGRLVSIMSAGVLFRENKKTVAFREMLNQYGHYERNPEGSFRVSGTGVNTIIVVMDKPKEA